MIFTPHPHPSPCFLTVDHPPWYKFISHPDLPLLLKSKMAVIIFVVILLSTRSPKLRLLCMQASRDVPSVTVSQEKYIRPELLDKFGFRVIIISPRIKLHKTSLRKLKLRTNFRKRD